MLEIRIQVTGLDKLAEAINHLAGVKASTAVSMADKGTGGSSGMSQPVTETSVPVSAPNALGTPVPTSTVPQVYTQDQIAVAMTGLSDQGRSAELVSILAKFGVPSLVQVPKERYPELVLLLREAGAAI